MRLWRHVGRHLAHKPCAAVQLASYEKGLRWVGTAREAFEAAELDQSVWKISFEHNDQWVRLVRCEVDGNAHWVFDPMERYLPRG